MSLAKEEFMTQYFLYVQMSLRQAWGFSRVRDNVLGIAYSLSQPSDTYDSVSLSTMLLEQLRFFRLCPVCHSGETALGVLDLCTYAREKVFRYIRSSPADGTARFAPQVPATTIGRVTGGVTSSLS